jgi:hypothetical protein
MIPPFPRKFADVLRLREKYGIKPTWYALFSASDLEEGALGWVSPIGAARKKFAKNFRGLWQVLLSGGDEQELEALAKAAPEGSVKREYLERVFERFPFLHYLQMLEFLAGDWGPDALVELSCGSILYNYDGDLTAAMTMVRAECESAGRVFEALHSLNVSALPGECILESPSRHVAGGIAPWLAPYDHEEAVRRFRRQFLPEPDYDWPV